MAKCIKRLEPRMEAHILDVGAGTGILGEHVS